MCQTSNCGDLQVEIEDVRRRAILGDLAPALAHECSNFLNVVLLQLAVLEMDMSDSIGPQLEEIRRQGEKLQKLLEQFHRHRKARSQQLSAICLEQAWQALQHEGRSLWSRQASDLPHVLATDIDVRHLLEFLLTHALQWGCEAPTLQVDPVGPRVYLRLHCPNAREEVESLEWLACQSIARRVQGKAYSKPNPERGRDYIVELQQPKEA